MYLTCTVAKGRIATISSFQNVPLHHVVLTCPGSLSPAADWRSAHHDTHANLVSAAGSTLLLRKCYMTTHRCQHIHNCRATGLLRARLHFCLVLLSRSNQGFRCACWLLQATVTELPGFFQPQESNLIHLTLEGKACISAAVLLLCSRSPAAG
jgi:hypothetical protein